MMLSEELYSIVTLLASVDEDGEVYSYDTDLGDIKEVKLKVLGILRHTDFSEIKEMKE